MMGEAREGPVTATRASSTAWLALEKIEMMQQHVKYYKDSKNFCFVSTPKQKRIAVRQGKTSLLVSLKTNLIAFTRRCEYLKCELKL